ncbi:MAG: CotH kinase family protein, partial [Eubacteriales bacterium]
MKKLIFTVICVFALAGAVFASDTDMDLSVTLPDGRTFASTEAGEVFLPSYTDPTEIVFNFAKTGISYESPLTNKKIGISSGDKLDITGFRESDGTYSVKFYDGDTEYAYTVFISSSLPSIHITTSIGKDKIVSQYPQTDTNVKTAIINKNGKYEYVDTEHMHGELKVRGNTTDTYAKKPFQLKLNEKKNLFGMGEAKTWILLANYLDQSFIRNSVMYKLGSLIGMDACEFQSVDLFLDGEYYGVYLLCEKVQIGKSRVNITDLEKENDKLNATYGSIVSVTSGELIDKGILKEYRYINGVTDPEDITGG